MNTDQKRQALFKLYGPSWAGRVMKMSDTQIHAVYARHLFSGAFKKKEA